MWRSFERVVVDSSVLLGPSSPEVVAGAALGYYRAYWSTWIVAEYVRNRVERTTEQAARAGSDRAEVARQLEATRDRVNSAIGYLSRVLVSTEHASASPACRPVLSGSLPRKPRENGP